MTVKLGQTRREITIFQVMVFESNHYEKCAIVYKAYSTGIGSDMKKDK